MKCKRIIYQDVENITSPPRIVYGKLLSEDDHFISFLTGRGRSYRIAKNHVLAVEDSEREFILEGE